MKSDLFFHFLLGLEPDDSPESDMFSKKVERVEYYWSI